MSEAKPDPPPGRLFDPTKSVAGNAQAAVAYKSTTRSNGHPAVIGLRTLDIVHLKYSRLLDGTYTPVQVLARLISDSEADAAMRKNESQGGASGPNGFKILWATNNLAMSDEDRSSVHAFSAENLRAMKDVAGNGSSAGIEFWRRFHRGELSVTSTESARVVLASVLDGVQGSYAAELTNRVLHACVASAYQGEGCPTDAGAAKEVITKVFEALGEIHSRSAITHLSPNGHTANQEKFPFLPPLTSQMMSPGALFTPTTGTTLLTAMIDTSTKRLYVANLGDCRAVAGWYHPSLDKWECDVLTEDLTPENPNEAARLIAEHPETPPEVLIQDRGIAHGTFGFGSHTRSFGGAMQRVKSAELGPCAEALGKPIPEWYIAKGATHQSYTSITPQITVRDLEQKDKKLGFVILATDGIWDRLTSEEAVSLIAAQLSGNSQDPSPNRIVPKSELPDRVPLLQVTDPDARLYPAQPPPGSAGSDMGSWEFTHSHLATHLICNAIGDGDPEVRRMVMSLRAPEGRDMRDDMTATVLLF